MANLLDLPTGKLLALVTKLAAAGVTAEEAEECLQADGKALKRRVAGFKSPPALPEEAPAKPVPPPEPLWAPVPENPNAILVNLGFSPNLPFNGAIPDAWRWGRQEGVVLVEWKENALWVDGVKQERHLVPEQKPGSSLRGHKLKQRLEPHAALQVHPNVMDAAIESGILPVSFGKDEAGNVLYLHAWGVGFRGANDNQFVRCFFPCGVLWDRGYDSLVNYWGWNVPSLSASFGA